MTPGDGPSGLTWFAPGFLERNAETATELLDSLQGADRFGYAAVCGALAAFDVRDRLGEIRQPVLVATGEYDQATPISLGEEIAAGVRNGHFVTIEQCAHLPPAEQPAAVAELLITFLIPRRSDRSIDMGTPRRPSYGGL